MNTLHFNDLPDAFGRDYCRDDNGRVVSREDAEDRADLREAFRQTRPQRGARSAVIIATIAVLVLLAWRW